MSIFGTPAPAGVQSSVAAMGSLPFGAPGGGFFSTLAPAAAQTSSGNMEFIRECVRATLNGGLSGSSTPSTPAFRASGQQQGTSLFGQTPNPFGQPQQTPAFGQTQASFGQTPQTLTFGQAGQGPLLVWGAAAAITVTVQPGVRWIVWAASVESVPEPASAADEHVQ